MTPATNFVLLFLVSIVALTMATSMEDQRASAPLGTMRFGKRFLEDLYDDYVEYSKRSAAEEETQRSIRTPLGTMRFGKRGPLGTMRFGKRSIGERDSRFLGESPMKRQPTLGTMRFGKLEMMFLRLVAVVLAVLALTSMASAAPNRILMRFGKRSPSPYYPLHYDTGMLPLELWGYGGKYDADI